MAADPNHFLKGGKRTKSRRQRGGDYGQYPDSAWGFQMNNLGNGWTQFMNSLSLQPGDTLASSQSNNIVANKQVNTGGGRRRRRHSRGKRGGNMLAVVEQAAVPLALLGMQQAYGKNRTRKARSFRHKSRRHRH